MFTLLAFVAGCVVGWMALRLIINWGIRKADVQQGILDKLGFEALVRFRDSANAEIQKRSGS